MVYKKSEAGVTSIELLVVVAITVLLAVAAIPIYGGLQVSAQLNENTARIIQTLRTSRQRSVSRYNNAAHGVYFEINASAKDKVILYQGSSYATRESSNDRETILDSALSLSTTLTGSEVNFSQGLGRPNNTGTLTLTHDVTGSRVIDINTFGKIAEQ